MTYISLFPISNLLLRSLSPNLKKMKKFILVFLTMLLFESAAEADSFYNRRLPSGEYLFDNLLAQGVPRQALDLMFRLYDYNEGRIPNVDSGVLVDYSLRSTEKRLYYMNFVTGQIERHYVAHGIRSGVLESRNFSNLGDSWKSALGFYYAKGTYNSPKNGLSLYLDGIDRSNNNAKIRQIVLHGAKYVSDEFIAKNGRLGWSEGCFAIPLEAAPGVITALQAGSILLSYHKDLMTTARQYPWEQSLLGEEIVPRGVNRNRTPGEGGGTDFMQGQSINPTP